MKNFRNFKTIEFEITNFDRINPRNDQKTYSWMRVDNNFGLSSEYFGLGVDQKYAWLIILGMANEAGSSKIKLVTDYVAHKVGVSQKKILALLSFLEEGGLIRIDAGREHLGLEQSQAEPVKSPTENDSETLANGSVRARAEACEHAGIRADAGENGSYDTLRDDTKEVAPISSDGNATTSVESRTKDPAPTREVWKAYADAYQRRYGVAPLWNQATGGKLKHFLARVPKAEAPQIAEFFLGHDNPFYVRQMHPVGLMLQDAEKLRTQWKTEGSINPDEEIRERTVEEILGIQA